MKICCFIGHKHIRKRAKLIKLLDTKIEFLIKEGYDNFIFGTFGTFDTLAFVVCLGLKNQYKHISINQVVSDNEICETLSNENNKFNYLYLPTNGNYKEFILNSYKSMVDKSDYIVSYVNPNRKISNAKSAEEYAKSNNKNIENIYF